MTDYEDYENNLAFPPTTDRTQSTIEKLTEENARFKELIYKCREMAKQIQMEACKTELAVDMMNMIDEVLK